VFLSCKNACKTHFEIRQLLDDLPYPPKKAHHVLAPAFCPPHSPPTAPRTRHPRSAGLTAIPHAVRGGAARGREAVPGGRPAKWGGRSGCRGTPTRRVGWGGMSGGLRPPEPPTLPGGACGGLSIPARSGVREARNRPRSALADACARRASGRRRDAQRGRLGRGALHAPPLRHPRGLRHDLSQKLRRLAARRGARAGQQFRSTPSVTSRASRRMTHDARRTACARPHRFPQPLYRANGRRGCCGR
jgi:hypothetical protein